MVANRLSDHEWQIAKHHCTHKQIQALDYWRHGYGYSRIAIILGIPRDTARGRITRARTTIQIQLARPNRRSTITNSEAA